MTLPVFPVAEVIERLRAKVPELRVVDGAAGLLAAEKQLPARMPAAFVIANEKGHPPKGFSGAGMVQEVDVTCVVVLYVSNAARANTGSAAQSDLDALTGKVRAALVNWRAMPHSGCTALHFLATDGEAFQAGAVQGQTAFGCNYRIQQGDNP